MSFAQFPEQQQVVNLLQRSLEKGRLGHAYLFTGSRIEDLEIMARTLAKTLNCKNPTLSKSGSALPLDCCDECDSCRRIQEDLHPDMQWIRPESKMRVILIAQVREMLRTVHLRPTEARFKFAFIVGADRMNEQAANAFLKTLEEPPASSILILLSTQPQRLLDTILSRCLRLHFAGDGSLQTRPEDLTWLSDFAKSASSSGSLLGRYKLLRTLLARLGAMKTEITEALTARSPLNKYDDAEADLREKWEDELAASIESQYRLRRSELLLAVQWWLRDVWLTTHSAQHEMCSFPQLVEDSNRIASRISSGDALENLAQMESTQQLLYTNVQEALALEVGFLKLRFG